MTDMELAEHPVHDPDLARALLDRIERSARRWDTPCGGGGMVWRAWGNGPPLLALHGGAGSWRHWVRNLAALTRTHTVIAPDLPGLGESAPAPDPIGAEPIARLVLQGLEAGTDPAIPLHVAGFSFGGVIAGLVAAMAGERLRSLTLIGTGGLGPPARSVELVRVRDKSGAERVAAQRENLLRLMLGHAGNVDALALEIQEQNAQRARLNSGFMWQSRVLHDALPQVRGRVFGIWGQQDMPDATMLQVRIGLLRAARPDAPVQVIPDAGHWVFYEAAAAFNTAMHKILTM